MPHPLAESFAPAVGRCFGAQLDERPDDGWLDAAALCRDEHGLARLTQLAAAGYATDRADILGIRLLEIWTWLVAAPAAVSLLSSRRLPDLAADNVLIAESLYAAGWPIALRSPRFWCLPDDPQAGHPDAIVVADEAALLTRLNRTLSERHLAPLIATVGAMSRRSERALWRAAGDRLINAFTWTGEQLDREPEALRLAALSVDAPAPLNPAFRVESYRFDGLPPVDLVVRAGCCLYYRIPDAPKCVNCPLLDERRRAEQVESDLRARTNSTALG